MISEVACRTTLSGLKSDCSKIFVFRLFQRFHRTAVAAAVSRTGWRGAFHKVWWFQNSAKSLQVGMSMAPIKVQIRRARSRLRSLRTERAGCRIWDMSPSVSQTGWWGAFRPIPRSMTNKCRAELSHSFFPSVFYLQSQLRETQFHLFSIRMCFLIYYSWLYIHLG
jgi:hypothetical protein